MRTRLAFLGSLVAIMVFSGPSIFRGADAAAPASGGEATIAVVRVMEILQNCAKDQKQVQEALTDRSKARAELEQRAKEIELEESDLKMLKPDSNDYIEQLDRVLEKKARYDSRKELLERQIALKQQVWTRKTYAEVVRVTREVAAEKGFHLVLAADQSELPVSDAIGGIIAMQKVLYCDGCPDITDEVKARLARGKP